MGTDPEQLRREIEQTRRELTYDVDALNEKVNPGKVVERRVARTRSAASGLRDRVMGAAQGTATAVAERTPSSSDVSGAGHDLASGARAKAEGNPLAAGLIAFGAGWLLSSLLPASDAEQRAATRVTDAAKDVAQPLAEQAKQVATEIKDDMQPAAQRAVGSVKETAAGAVQTVRDEGASAAQDVRGDAQQAASTVREEAGSSR